MKDTNNLYDYNVWSGTEYNENIEGFAASSEIQLIPSKYFSNIGESSLRVNSLVSGEFVELQRVTSVTVGKTFTVSLIIYNPTVQVRCRLKSDNNSNIITITVPPSENSKRVSVAGVIPSSYGGMGLRIFMDGVGSVYIDDISSTTS